MTKIINSKEEKKKMNNECPNCGYKMSSKDKICKYCGTKNENYSGSVSFMSDLIDAQNKQAGEPKQLNNKTGFVVAGIVFLFIFWPVSILFFMLASRVDKNN